jgi:hypothetical protein
MMKTTELEFHEIANIFPLMDGEEFLGLKHSIAENGQREPIIIFNGKIIDGRNRYRVCSELGINPDFCEWDENGSLVEFVWDRNYHRRNLSPGQRAGCSLKFEKQLAKEAKERMTAGINQYSSPTQKFAEGSKGEARKIAATKLGTNRQYVSDMKKLDKEHPEKFAEVMSGEKNIPQVKKEIRKEENIKKQKLATESLPNKKLWALTRDEGIIECDVVVTDPPYGILSESWEPDELGTFTTEWGKKWNGCGADFFLIFWSQRYLFDGRKWFDESLCDYHLQQLLIWHYPNNKSPQSRIGFKQTWEPIFFYRHKNTKREVKVDGYEWGDGLNDFDCHVAAVPQTNFNNENMKQHPAQKPVEVMKWLVNATTRPGDLVVDPFCGSGTTGIAATQLGRKFHGIETNAEYLKTAEGRLAFYGQ